MPRSGMQDVPWNVGMGAPVFLLPCLASRVFIGMGIGCLQRKGVDMKSTAVADVSREVTETRRLTHSQFGRWLHNRDVAFVDMEACGSAHRWARHLFGLAIPQGSHTGVEGQQAGAHLLCHAA